jgi:hypothetical protein
MIQQQYKDTQYGTQNVYTFCALVYHFQETIARFVLIRSGEVATGGLATISSTLQYQRAVPNNSGVERMLSFGGFFSLAAQERPGLRGPTGTRGIQFSQAALRHYLNPAGLQDRLQVSTRLRLSYSCAKVDCAILIEHLKSVTPDDLGLTYKASKS